MSEELAGYERFAAAEDWEDNGHNARRVHWRTIFSENCTDVLHLIPILSTFSEYPDCPSTRKKRLLVLSGDYTQKYMEVSKDSVDAEADKMPSGQ